MRARPLLLSLAFAVLSSAPLSAQSWWKGNLHTHTLWSDGDEFPDMVLAMYKDRGYHFVAVSDHNVLGKGTMTFNPWMSLDGREAVEAYVARFGTEWVEIEEIRGQRLVKLKTIDECAQLLDEEGRFLVLQGQEITDDFEGTPVHLNATNLVEFVPPQRGETVLDTMQRNLDAVYEQRSRTGVPMIAHLNHPNFHYGITLQDLIDLRGERFFEVYNGHPAVHNEGDDTHPSTERMWDIINSLRAATGRELLFGLAVDDAHAYRELSARQANPFRGWVMVRAPALEAELLIAALEAGDFYSSSGVTLSRLETTGGALEIEIAAQSGVNYRTRFIGTRRAAAEERRSRRQYGAVLAEVVGTQARYELTGDELFVRAVVLSDRLKENPYREGELEKAWIQPIRAEGP